MTFILKYDFCLFVCFFKSDCCAYFGAHDCCLFLLLICHQRAAERNPGEVPAPSEDRSLTHLQAISRLKFAIWTLRVNCRTWRTPTQELGEHANGEKAPEPG